MSAPLSPTDAELAANAATGSSQAQAALVDRYKRLVYSIPKRYSLDDSTCDDVFQNVFIALFRSLNSVRDQQSISKWLMTTTHRECWRISRKTSPPDEWTQSQRDRHDAPPDDAAETWERQARVHEGLSDLGGMCEKLLRAIFLERNAPDYSALADRLGLAVGSIGPTRARCLAKLAQILQPDLESEV